METAHDPRVVDLYPQCAHRYVPQRHLAVVTDETETDEELESR